MKETRSAERRPRRRQIWPERPRSGPLEFARHRSGRARHRQRRRRTWCTAARSAPRPAHHTGRSPKDKFVVADAHDRKNRLVGRESASLAQRTFRQLLFDDFIAHAKGKTLYAQDLYGGADPKYRIKVRVYNELAWHSLFIRALLDPPRARRAFAATFPDFTICRCRRSRPIPNATACAARDHHRHRFHQARSS